MPNQICKTVAAACVAAVSLAVSAKAGSPVKLGELNCQVTDYDRGLLKTEITLDCSYVDADGSNAGAYKGKIGRSGLDIGNIKTDKFTWIVSTLGDPADPKIASTYIGAAGGASAEVGAAANV